MVKNYKLGHIEWIECPECKKEQGSFVEYTFPFYSYVHECLKCKYIIMESEWNETRQLINANNNPNT